MGVFGLTQFIKRDCFILESYLLYDTRLMVDGNGLIHWLFYETGVDCVRGGDYQNYEDVCCRFFQSLQRCNIRPSVLIDGAVDLEGGKRETLERRATEKIKRSLSISRGGAGKILPPFAFEIFLNTMKKLSIPYIVCDFEADGELVSLANYWNCPIMAEDGDFFIFDIKSGYIPRSSFNWRDLRANSSSTTGQALHTEIYYLERFCDKFHITKAHAPILASLLGNDYIPRGAFDDFFRNTIKRESGGQGGNINSILRWLSVQSSVDATKADMNDSCDGKTKEKFKNALELYEVQSGSTFIGYLEGHSPVPKIEIIEFPGLLPDWFSEVCRAGKLPATVINTMVQYWHINSVFVEDCGEPSCNKLSLSIRKTLFGIMLGKTTDGSACEKPNLPNIEEFSRESSSLALAVITPLLSLEKYGKLPSLHEVPSMPLSKRKDIICETLGSLKHPFEGVHHELQLPIAVTMYWIKNANPRIFASHLHALLLCFLRGYITNEKSFEKRSDDSPTEYTKTIDPSSKSCPLKRSKETTELPFSKRKMAKISHTIEQLLNNIVREEGRRSNLDLKTVQAYAQWQSCMQYAAFLNRVLQEPYPPPDMTKLYKGTLVHNLCAVLESIDIDVDLFKWVKTKLEEVPDAQLIYQLLYTTVSDQTGELGKIKRDVGDRRAPQSFTSRYRDRGSWPHTPPRKHSFPSQTQTSQEKWTSPTRTSSDRRWESRSDSRDNPRVARSQSSSYRREKPAYNPEYRPQSHQNWSRPSHSVHHWERHNKNQDKSHGHKHRKHKKHTG